MSRDNNWLSSPSNILIQEHIGIIQVNALSGSASLDQKPKT